MLSYNALQAAVVAGASPGRFVTHNLMMLFFDFDAWALARQARARTARAAANQRAARAGMDVSPAGKPAGEVTRGRGRLVRHGKQRWTCRVRLGKRYGLIRLGTGYDSEPEMTRNWI